MLKKLLIAAAGLALSAPVLADHGRPYRHYAKHHHFKHHPVHHRFVAPRPVVYHYYRPAPVVVYRPAPVYYAPAYHQVDPVTGLAVVAGALVGAAIVHSIATGH